MRIVLFVWFCILSISVCGQERQNLGVGADSLSEIDVDSLSEKQLSAAARLKADTLTIIGVGDIMMGTNYPEDRLPPNNGDFLMRQVAHVLQDADVTFGNLEGTLLDEGGTPKKCNDPKVCYAFRSPVRYVQNLVDAGFDMMSLANNHAGDMGYEGRDTTMKVLINAGILHAGQMSMKTTI